METSKTWFITGSSTVLGLEIVRAALLAGDKVAAAVLPQDVLRLTQLLGEEPRLFIVETDITSAVESAKAIKNTINCFGRIDILVNNADYGVIAAIEETTDAEIRLQYEINVFGMLNIVKEILPFFRKQRSGYIINVSSLLVFDPIPGWSVYASTKLAVEGITKGLALELAPFNIKVTAIEPGLLKNGFAVADTGHLGEKIIDDYSGTLVAYMREDVFFYRGTGRGDSKKIAEVVMQLAGEDHPPVLLPIGPDSLSSYFNQVKKMNNNVKKWESIVRNTNVDPGIKGD